MKIWEDRKALPLAVFKPHDGNPVNSVTFLTAPHRPDHIVLITAVYASNLSIVSSGKDQLSSRDVMIFFCHLFFLFFFRFSGDTESGSENMGLCRGGGLVVA